jgi:hypothetical protein
MKYEPQEKVDKEFSGGSTAANAPKASGTDCGPAADASKFVQRGAVGIFGLCG